MDRIIRCITSDGGVLVCAVESTDIVYTAQKLHGLTKTTTAALGRLLTGASIMGSMLKIVDSSLTVKINGKGPIGNLVAVADERGNVKGFVDNSGVDLPMKSNGKINVGGAVGLNGSIVVIKDSGNGDPYIGQVELISGEIAEDITGYYAQSEQIPTMCALGVLVDKEKGEVVISGGLFIQALPGADESTILTLEHNIEKLESVTTMLAKGMSLEDICRTSLEGFDVEKLSESNIRYVCGCSKERYAKALLTLGAEELEEMAKESDETETICHYCNKRYYFSAEEILNITKMSKNS